ncbi:hypothetical protein WJX74_005825 [Apatococcus lobatus]|uniref:Uncharacterized protein n=1 Tax=Apatococcus lobatus TaxID=904363 RepID=A0AAW1RYU4_9CHLO
MVPQVLAVMSSPWLPVDTCHPVVVYKIWTSTASGALEHTIPLPNDIYGEEHDGHVPRLRELPFALSPSHEMLAMAPADYLEAGDSALSASSPQSGPQTYQRDEQEARGAQRDAGLSSYQC